MHNQIGIKITTTKPSGLNHTEAIRDYCSFIGMARTGLRFYTENKDISCPLAKYQLGLETFTDQLTDALIRSLIGWGDAKEKDIALKFISSRPTLPVEEKYIIYFPYPDSDLEPDIVIHIGTPSDILTKVRRHTYLTGESVLCAVSGVGSLCGECTASTISNNQSVVSLGCTGSRTGIKLRPDEILIAIPYNTIDTFF